MKPQQMPTWLTRTLLFGLGLVFILMPVHAFISTWGGTAIGPLWLWKSWKELLMFGLLVLVLVWLFSRPQLLSELFKRPYVIVLSTYVGLTVLLAAVYARHNGLDATAAGLGMNLRYLVAAVLASVLFRYGNLGSNWFSRASIYLLTAGVVMSLLGIVQVFLLPSDFLTHFGYDKLTTIAPNVLIDNNPDNLRAFATLRGPNDFGAFLILPLILVIARLRKDPLWFSSISIVIMVAALTLSSSRSAWIGAIVGVGSYLLLRAGRKLSSKQLGITAGALVISGCFALVAAVSVPALRLAVFHSSPGDSSLTEGSTDNHVSATVNGVRRVTAHPLGCGPGCAGPASYYSSSPQISENYFVQIAEEVGVVGLVLFLILVGMVAYELYRQHRLTGLSHILLASLASYLVIGLLLHVWSDDPLSIMWWMFTGAMIGYNESQRWMKSKDKSRSRLSSSS